jgi:hypothetical protein
VVLAIVAGCSGPSPTPAAEPAAEPAAATAAAADAVADAGTDEPALEEGWLKGNTHVHALPSGDSKTPILEVIAWYQQQGYDFISLTDHNHISEVGETSTAGSPAVQTDGLIVLAGTELTYNPDVCDPPPPPEYETKCRIHVNLLGPTARPEGKLNWPNRESPLRLDSYQAALDRAAEWGGLVQINHPTWYWGMSAELLTELGKRGARFVEIANKQFMNWSEGDDTHPSVETLWDAALSAGVTMWGIASDDAHDYTELETARYPAGGHFVMVWAAREPHAILAALDAGRFYASTGVLLARAESDGESLVVEIRDDSPGEHVITFIGDGKVIDWEHGRAASHPLADASYVRAVVRREDGARAWVQPARLHTAVGK